MELAFGKTLNRQSSLELLREAALQVLSAHHTDQVWYLRLLICNRAWEELVAFSVDYTGNDVSEVVAVRQALGFFEKLETLPIGVDKEAVAYQKFLDAEAQCALTNSFLKKVRRGSVSLRPRVASVLFTAQRKISKLLGDAPSLENLHFGFGPGASTSCKRLTSPRYKLGARLTCSYELAVNLEALLYEVPAWMSIHAKEETDSTYVVDVEVGPGDLMFVPKNAKTYRSIAVEPLLNTFYQKGVGRYIRSRLKRVGIDLRNQQTVNRQLAQEAIGRGLATIDLSSASDTISKEVVAELLPPEWESLLFGLRTGSVVYNGACIELEKFSSMGNGFTFELETLIFWSLAVAVCERNRLSTENVSVFGDDIIVPAAIVDELFDVLNVLGFSVNHEKSFTQGSFYESCGADYFLGMDVRPVYVKRNIEFLDLYRIRNRLNFVFPEAARLFEETIPEPYRIFGPSGYGDGHLHSTTWGMSKLSHRKRGWHGAIFDTFSYSRKRVTSEFEPGDFALPCYTIYQGSSEEEADPFVVRGRGKIVRRSIYVLNPLAPT